MTTKLRSSKRDGMPTRSTAPKHCTFVQLPNFKRHKHKRLPKSESTIHGDECASSSSILEDEYPVDIDFDDAHDEWTANKKRLANGNYVYLCGKITGSGNKCRRGCHDMIGLYSGCKVHYMWEEIEHHFD